MANAGKTTQDFDDLAFQRFAEELEATVSALEMAPESPETMAALESLLGQDPEAIGWYTELCQLQSDLRSSASLVRAAEQGKLIHFPAAGASTLVTSEEEAAPIGIAPPEATDTASSASPSAAATPYSSGGRLRASNWGMAALLAASATVATALLLPELPSGTYPLSATDVEERSTASRAERGGGTLAGNASPWNDRPADGRPKGPLRPEDIYPLSDKHPPLGGNGKLQGGVPEETGSLPEEIVFNRDIRPILSENCFYCHGPDANDRKADLRLDTFEGALADLGGYQAVAPGDPTASELIARIFDEDPDELMPPPSSNRHLTPEQREMLRRWVEQGAAYQKHWAFEPPRHEEPPTLEARREAGPSDPAEWVRNPIDAFILERLIAEGIEPSPQADRTTLLRRLSLDLIGLPPTPDEVEAFLADEEPGAYERQVERLMDSPHYGERMALPWLDASRYADSNGFQGDGDRHQWIWRDWLVDRLNENQPFDQFTIEMLAGDLLDNPTREQLIATGFNRNHVLNGEGGALAEEQRNNYVFDRVDATATVWLALTLACSQCHDHKYDPLSQEEYYRFFAYFNQMPETGRVDKRLGRIQYAEPSLSMASPEQDARQQALSSAISEHDKRLKEDKKAIAASVAAWWDAGLQDEKDSLPSKLRPLLDRPFEAVVPSEQRLATDHFLAKVTENEAWKQAQVEKKRLEGERDKLRREIPVVMIMKDAEKPRQTHILDRGDYTQPGEVVEPGIPEVLGSLPEGAPSNRLALAQWLVSDDNPLTARVIVNRYWQQYFGMGLVKTAEDFGVQGEAPSHPRLLDWLATEFVRSGWDVKHLHRLIVTSAAYRQSSRIESPDQLDRDPENRLIARGARYRLPAMVLRDQALQLGGLLDERIGGRPVYPYQPEGMWKEFSYEKFSYTPSSGRDLYRRSLYTFWRRTVAPPNMFDSANRQVCQVKPSRTNTPLHALTTLNDPTYVEAARALAERLLHESHPDEQARLRSAFRLATARPPREPELALLERTYQRSLAAYQKDPTAAEALLSTGESPRDQALDLPKHAAYTAVSQLLLNLDETLNRE